MTMADRPSPPSTSPSPRPFNGGGATPPPPRSSSPALRSTPATTISSFFTIALCSVAAALLLPSPAGPGAALAFAPPRTAAPSAVLLDLNCELLSSSSSWTGRRTSPRRCHHPAPAGRRPRRTDDDGTTMMALSLAVVPGESSASASASALPSPGPPPPKEEGGGGSRKGGRSDDGGGGRGRGRSGGRGRGRGRGQQQQRGRGRGEGRGRGRGRSGGGGRGRGQGRGRGRGRGGGAGRGGGGGDALRAELEAKRSALPSRYGMCLAAIREKDQAGRDDELTQPYCDSVLALCVASDDRDAYLEVLDIMDKHDGLSGHARSSYDACLAACHEVGNGSAALALLDGMRQQQGPPRLEPTAQDVATVVSTLCRQSALEKGAWRRGLALLEDAAVAAKAKDMSGKEGDENAVAEIVHVDAYNAVLRCMKDEGRWKEALQLLHLMQPSPPSSPPQSQSQSEDGGDNGDNDEAGEVSFHAQPNLATFHAVLGGCVAAGQAEQAVQLLLSLPDRGVKPELYTFELVVAGLLKKGQWRRALTVLDAMAGMEGTEGVSSLQSTKMYNTVISACGRAREAGAALDLFGTMKARNITPDVITYNSLMSAAASDARRWRDALTLFDQCHRAPGVEPDIITYTNAMRACAKGKQTRRALSLFEVVKDKGLKPDAYCYTAVIDACAKGNMWRKALDLLDEMRENGVQPNVVTYSVAIAACGNGGQWERALELLNQMRDKGLQINAITYNAAIAALAKAARSSSKEASRLTAPEKYRALSAGDGDDNGDVSGNGATLSPEERSRYLGGEVDEVQLWARALELLEQMKKRDGVEPDTYSYSAAIGACGAGGRWEEALELLRIMKEGGNPRTRPNRIAYTAAISACGQSGEWEHALRLFDDMRSEDGLQPDRVAYNALVSGLRVAGQTDKVYEVWREMCGMEQEQERDGDGSDGDGDNSGAIRNAATRADASRMVSPDIITVTDVLATLDRTKKSNREKIDLVFTEAVRRGIVLPSDSMDTTWEVDMSGMSLPVAHAACHFLIARAVEAVQKGESECSDLTLITGVGGMQQQLQQPRGSLGTSENAVRVFVSEEEEREAEEAAGGGQEHDAAAVAPLNPKRSSLGTHLREYVREILRDDFEPPLYSTIPQYAKGTVQVKRGVLQKYIDAHS